MFLQLNKKSDHFMGSDLFYFRYRLSLPGGLSVIFRNYI